MSQIERIPLRCLFGSSSMANGSSRPGGSRQRSRQGGAIAVMTAILMAVIFGFCGLALDLSRLYNRKVELKNMAEAVAITAARKLNGTPSGVSDAVLAASQTASQYTFQYNQFNVSWSAAALTFATSPDGPWSDSGTATASAARTFFVKVDTSQLDPAHGLVEMVFMPVINASLKTAAIIGSAIAGRTSINVTPFAICAMATTPAAQRPNAGVADELVEYGFRRGVSYDLMRLNPNDANTAVNYVVNPIAAPGGMGASTDTDPATVGPYVCAGSMASPALLGGTVRVTSPFPLDSLYRQLNSRFEQFDGLCDFHGAPPDTNVKEFTVPDITWVKFPVAGQTAAEPPALPSNTRLQTVADLAGAGGSAEQYGPIWIYAKAAQWAATEPATGYSAYPTSAWANLYGGQEVSSTSTYPAITPYKAIGSGPSAAYKPGLADRRVLNVPLLSCPVAGGANVQATVLGIGKFFMTVRATTTKLSAEFAGAIPLGKVTGEVELYR